MNLDDYFDFQAPDDIRLKGTRVGIETVLYDFIHRGRRPEEIADAYRSLSLEQVYATITYYLRNEDAVRRYLTQWVEHGRRMRAEQSSNPDAWPVRVRQAKAELVARRRAAIEAGVECARSSSS